MCLIRERERERQECAMNKEIFDVYFLVGRDDAGRGVGRSVNGDDAQSGDILFFPPRPRTRLYAVCPSCRRVL